MNVYTLGYPASLFEKWAKREMNLYERAKATLECLASYEFGERPIVFISHSLGGLLVKQILKTGYDSSDARWKRIAKNIRLIFFLATPHTGSSLASVFSFCLPRLNSNHIVLLRPGNSELDQLNDAYRKLAPKLKIKTVPFYEMHRTRGGVIIVDKVSADPGVPDTEVLPVDADHETICKPASRTRQVYVSVCRHLSELLQSNLNAPMVSQAGPLRAEISSSRPDPHLTLFEARTELVSGSAGDAAALSAYRTDIVPLLGRQDFVDDMWVWLDRKASVSIRILVGEGGRGKTRLALEVARQASKKGWRTGFLTEPEMTRFLGQQNVSDWRWSQHTLVIVDYAASVFEGLREWLNELANAAREARPNLRILLLERHADGDFGWMASVFGRGENDTSLAKRALLDSGVPLELPPISDSLLRRQIFSTLLSYKRPDLIAPQPGSDPEFDRLLASEKWAGDPLFLMMAGLVAGSEGIKSALALSRTDLAEKIARRELNRVGAIAAANGIDQASGAQSGALGRHLAALTTLASGLSRREARQIIEDEKLRLGSLADTSSVLRALRDALPAEVAGHEIAPIQPDMIGEAALLIWLGPELAFVGLDGYASVERVAKFALDRASAVLIRAAQDFGPSGWDEPIRWLCQLVERPTNDLRDLLMVANRLPDQTVELRSLALNVLQRLVDRFRKEIEGTDGLAAHEKGHDFARAELSELLIDLCIRLQHSEERKEDAVAAAQEAVDILRDLTVRHQDLLPNLARSLQVLGNRLSDVGHFEQALKATENAVMIRRSLAGMRSNTLDFAFAGALEMLGVKQASLGKFEEAAATVTQAVEFYRDLTKAQPDMKERLAAALYNLGKILDGLGRWKEARSIGQEAVDIRRRLAVMRPDQFEPDLARSLNNLSSTLDNLQQHLEALTLSQEAVTIFRRLAGKHPEFFRLELAQTIGNLGNRLVDFGRDEEALAAVQEAAMIFADLMKVQPQIYRKDLAATKVNIARILLRFGRIDEALKQVSDAVAIFRKLEAERPQLFQPDFPTALLTLADVLERLERFQEARTAADEAIDILRAQPSARPSLADALNSLGNILSYLGLRNEALKAGQEAVDLLEALDATEPHVFRPKLAAALANLSPSLKDVGRLGEALDAARKAVDNYRRLVVGAPQVSAFGLALALNTLSKRFADLGQHDQALPPAREAVELLGPMFLQDHAQYARAMSVVVGGYFKSCKALAKRPDERLVKPIIRALRDL